MAHNLNDAESYALCKWIEKNKAELLATRPSDVTTAVRAEKELGFHITASSIASRRLIVGIRFIGGHRGMRRDRTRVLARVMLEVLSSFDESAGTNLSKTFGDTLRDIMD